jgi:hypothetical protein
MFVLPVSGAVVHARAPRGCDDMVLCESFGSDALLRVELVRRLTPLANPALTWDTLPYVDVDAALLGLRQLLTGDRVVAEIQCTECTTWGDVELSIAEYLRANRPRPPRAPGGVRFPTVAQVLAALTEYGPGKRAARALEAEILPPSDQGAARRLRATLERAAPLLSRAVGGPCPHCGAAIVGWFDPGAFVVAEMRAHAARLLEEVHLVASRYGWQEDAILALPGPRRTAYVEFIEMEGRVSL